MAAEVSLSTQLINVWVQCINLIVFYMIFKKVFGDQIIESVEHKKSMMQRIKYAEQEYDELISKAKTESDLIISQAMDHKKSVIDEAHHLAQQKTADMLESANRKASDIVASAQVSAQKLEQELKANFESGVKTTAEVVVSKLIGEKAEFQKAYMDQLVKDIVK